MVQTITRYFKTIDVVFRLKVKICLILLQTSKLGMRKKRKILYIVGLKEK